MDTLGPDARITRELDPGEALIWSGRPVLSFHPTFGHVVRLVFALWWCALPAGLLWVGFSEGGPLLVGFLGIIGMAIGLLVAFGDGINTLVMTPRTAYGLTNTRVIVVSELRGRHVLSLRLESIPDISLIEHSGGVGDVVLGALPLNAAFLRIGRRGGQRIDVPKLKNVPQARQVVGLIRAAQRSVA